MPFSSLCLIGCGMIIILNDYYIDCKNTYFLRHGKINMAEWENLRNYAADFNDIIKEHKCQ